MDSSIKRLKYILLTVLVCLTSLLHAQQIVPLKDTAGINIVVKGTQIFRNDQPAGSFKLRSIDGLTFIKIYSQGHARIAEATHEQDSTTWTIVTPVDQEKMYAPYYPQASLPQLFRFLVIKGYL